MERCIGCHSCSLACARLVHKHLSWNLAGIRIRSAGGLSTGFEPKYCQACDPAPCAAACPTGAFTQRKGGGVKVDMDLCTNCGDCARACPVDAIVLSPYDGRPYVCIHCGRCVAFCPHDCLEMVEAPDRNPRCPLPAPKAAAKASGDTDKTSGETGKASGEMDNG